VDITIAIFTFNRARSLTHTLQALREVRIPAGATCELLVVDNASTDGTPQLIDSFAMPHLKIRNVLERRRGLSHARNTAIRESSGRVLVFLDDDVRPQPNWLERISEPILTGGADAVAGAVKIPSSLERPWMTPKHRAWLASTERLDSVNPDYIVGANMAFSRAVINKVPAFDPELGPGALGFYDDTLFSWQLREAGYRIVSRFDAVVEHHFDDSRLNRSAFLAAAQIRGRCLAYLRHHWKQEPVIGSRRKLAMRFFELSKRRFASLHRNESDEGISEFEMDLVMDFHFHKQYLVEKRHPFKYTKRGLVKLVT
jgi:glycosyltransferase involved in cell wall biosynthesis